MWCDVKCSCMYIVHTTQDLMELWWFVFSGFDWAKMFLIHHIFYLYIEKDRMRYKTPIFFVENPKSKKKVVRMIESVKLNECLTKQHSIGVIAQIQK